MLRRSTLLLLGATGPYIFLQQFVEKNKSELISFCDSIVSQNIAVLKFAELMCTTKIWY